MNRRQYFPFNSKIMSYQCDRITLDRIEKLIDLYRNGDQEAAAELYRIFSVQMSAMAHRIIRDHYSKSAIDVEGIVNSGFRSFFSAIKKPIFNSRAGNIGGLLYTIINRKAQVRLRRKYPYSKDPYDLHNRNALCTLINNINDPNYETILALDVKDVLDSLLRHLTEKEQQMMCSLLDPSDERSLQELATHYNTTVVTISHLYDLVQKQLRMVLDNQS